MTRDLCWLRKVASHYFQHFSLPADDLVARSIRREVGTLLNLTKEVASEGDLAFSLVTEECL